MEFPFTTAHVVFQFGFVIGRTELRSTPGCLPVTAPRAGLHFLLSKPSLAHTRDTPEGSADYRPVMHEQ